MFEYDLYIASSIILSNLDLLNSGSQPTIFLYFSDSLKKNPWPM